MIFWSFCIKAKGQITDAAGNKLRKEVLNDSIVLTGPFTENQYRARFITTDGQPTALDSTLLVAEDSIVFKPGFHAKSGLRLTAKIDSTLVPIDQTDYIGGIEYRNGGIQPIYHPQGRAVPDGSTWRHEYIITDHLGNTRLRFSDLDGNTFIDSTEILDEITYYPFGSPWQDAGYRYTYNGKELDRELGLKWHHYGARMYDPIIARFTGVDPISDQFPWVSTFNYAENEPVANIDLHGLQKKRYDSKALNNRTLQSATAINDQTSGGTRLNKALKGQDQIDLVYTILPSFYSGQTLGPIESFDVLKAEISNRPAIKRAIEGSLEEYNQFFEGGKSIIIVGVACDDTCLDADLRSATLNLNHEEVAHVINRLMGVLKTAEEEHKDFFGRNWQGPYSPNDEDIKKSSQFKGSEAKKQMDEIDEILGNEDEN